MIEVCVSWTCFGDWGEFWLHLLLLSFPYHVMGCIDVCLEKRREDSRLKQELHICLVESVGTVGRVLVGRLLRLGGVSW